MNHEVTCVSFEDTTADVLPTVDLNCITDVPQHLLEKSICSGTFYSKLPCRRAWKTEDSWYSDSNKTENGMILDKRHIGVTIRNIVYAVLPSR